MTTFHIEQWLEAKENETIAVEWRRSLEDKMVRLFKIEPSLDGTVNREVDGYEIKIVGRLTRKVDSDKLQEVAAENGLSEHLQNLFRWKPEINSKAWQAADSSITDILAQAITTTPGRPSFTILPTINKE